MTIVCTTCDQMEMMCIAKIKYLKKMRQHEVSPKYKFRLHRQHQQQIYYAKKLNRIRSTKVNLPTTNTHVDTFISNEVNVRIIFSTYYLGNGPNDISNALSFLGIPGGCSYCTHYYRKMEDLNSKVMDICAKIIEERSK